MKYRLVSIVSIVFGMFLLIVVAAANFVFYVSEIRFDTRGAAPINSLVVEAGDTFVLPEPDREGYTFGGWFLEETYENSANFLVLSNQDRTLYAYWIPNLYVVNFDSNGGSDVPSVSQTFDSEFLAPEQPILEGYDFGGWFLDDVTFTNPFTFGKMPLDTDLFAKWTPTEYNITYELNGGTLADLSPLLYTVEDDLVVFLDPIKTGHTFNGWFDNTAFDGNVYVAINPNRMADLTLFAKWTVNQYTITFDELGGSQVDNITQDFGTAVTAPIAPTKVGHTFVSWLFNGETFIFDFMPENGADLTALWSVNVYTVNLDLDNGSGITDLSPDFDYDSSITLNTPTRLGYTFTGWSDGAKLWETGDEMPNNDLSLTAQWSLDQYQITYIMDFGFNNDANPLTYTVLQAVTFAAPQKEGHTFNGWYSDAAFTQTITQIPVGSTGARTIYAKWTINTYIINLDVNFPDGKTGPALTQDTFTVNFASILDLPIPTLLGFTFEGWETENGVRFSNGNIMPAQNLELSAQWEVKRYEVKYYLFEADVDNASKLPSTATFLLGETVLEQSVPNPGYTFDGWFNSVDDQPFVFGFPMTDIATPYILYGKWTAIIYSVTYVLDGGTNNNSNPETFTVVDSIPLEPPSKPGYEFNGWQSDSVTVSTVGGAITDITLTANWDLTRYNITYDTAGGTNNFDNPRDFNVESNITLLPAVRSGYTFGGWRNQANNQIISTIAPGNSTPLTLTAVWTINRHTFTYRDFTGATLTTVNNKEFGSTLGMPTPTRRGYAFLGWADVATGTYYDSNDTMPDKLLDLVGEWETINYTASYELNGGTIASGSLTYDFTVLTSFTLPTLTKTGSVFVGWDVTGDETREHTGGSTVTAGLYAEDKTFTAIFTKTVYTLTFNSADGSSVASKNYFYSEEKANSFFPTPTKTGESFGGWFDANNVRWGSRGDNKNVMPNANLTLTARWYTVPFSITYDAANGEETYSTSIYPGQNVHIGFSPYREGYTFVGWKDEDEGIFYTKDSIMPAKALTLTAQWESNN